MLRIYIKPKVERITQYDKNAQNIKFMNRKVANYYVKIINELIHTRAKPGYLSSSSFIAGSSSSSISTSSKSTFVVKASSESSGSFEFLLGLGTRVPPASMETNS